MDHEELMKRSGVVEPMDLEEFSKKEDEKITVVPFGTFTGKKEKWTKRLLKWVKNKLFEIIVGIIIVVVGGMLLHYLIGA